MEWPIPKNVAGIQSFMGYVITKSVLMAANQLDSM